MINYTPTGVTFKDITIIRQHFANEVLINDLWQAKLESIERKDLAPYFKMIANATSFLDDMVTMTLTEPSAEMVSKITGAIKTNANGDVVPF